VTARTDTERNQVELLVAIRERDGIIGRPAYEAALTAMGREVTPGAIGNLRRKIARIAPAPHVPSAAYELSKADLAELARSPSLIDFHSRHVLGAHPDLTFSSWYRALHRLVDPGLLAYIKPGRGGMEAFRDATLSVLWSCEHFGEAWQADVLTLPFLAVPPGRGYRHPVKVQAIIVIDDATRLIVGWKLVYCTPGRAVRASDVCDVLIGAMDRWGVPEQVIVDNGKEFDNDRVSRCLKRAASTARCTPRYRGESKGKIERLNGTLVRWLRMAWPTWTEGRPSSARYPIQGGTLDGAPDHDTVQAFMVEMLDVRYNTKHRHRSLGKLTPMQAYEAGPTELLPLTLEKVLRFGSVHNEGRRDEFHDVLKTGINLNGNVFTNMDPTSPGRNGRPGSVALAAMRASRHGVRIRLINGDPTRIGVFDVDDEFVCIATRMDKIPTEVKLAHSTAVAGELLEAERIAIESQERVMAEHALNVDSEVDEDELARRRRARTARAAVADALNTDLNQVEQRFAKFTHDGKAFTERHLEIVDRTVHLGVHNTASVIAAWADRDHLPLYRIDTPSQAVVYDPDTGFVTITSKSDDTEPVLQMRIVLDAA